MNESLFLVSLVLLLCGQTFSEEILLEGHVKNSNSQAIEKAEISLTNQSLATTTDSDGFFSLVSTGIAQQFKKTSHMRFQLKGKHLHVTFSGSFSSGHADFFGINGRRVLSLPLKSEKTVISLPQNMPAIVIARITIDRKTITNTLLFTDSKLLGYNGNISHYSKKNNTSTHFLDLSDIVDTLVVSKSGFHDKKVPLDSYHKQDIEIILQEETSEMPLVYDKENTGADCSEPQLPEFEDLVSISHLPDPFEKLNGTRITTRKEWRCRRAEIKAILEKYDVGEKPGKPETFEASFNNDKISITVGENGKTFNMSATVNRPAGAPDTPIPAIIGINTPTGSLPSNLFSSRKIASITFNADQLAPGIFSGGGRTSGNFYSIYPGATAGFMIRWAWGVSRIIDALEILPETKIDTKRIAVSGCSFQGKIALYAGAFDERIALTIPHESGGGGTISWRYSDMLEDRDHTEVENLHHALGAPWYAEYLAKFTSNPDKLPFDHHELIGMIAPRAVLCIESSQIARMGAEAARVDHLAAREIYKALGVAERMGATEENIGHCSWHNGFTPDLEAFIDKFLLGKENVNTDILRSKFTNIDRGKWIPWETPELK